jgi:hypothetical protein
MFFMDGTQKKMKLSRKVITHSSFAVSLFVRQKISVTNNKKNFWILIFVILDVQITKLLQLSLRGSVLQNKKNHGT